MRKSVIASMFGLAAALTISGYGGDVVAARGGLQIGGSRANFGTRSVAPGFTPDPIDINVVSGGAVDAGTLGLGQGCVGWVTRRPDYIVRMTSNSSSLRVYVTSSEDTTLVVNAANGTWHCNDDSYGGTSPSVDLGGQGAGQYDVWVGSYRRGVQAHATLHVTELGSQHP